MRYEDLPIEELTELTLLDEEIRDISRQFRELNRQYDEAPDGSTAKQEATARMKRAGRLNRAKWARVNEILDKVDEDE